MSSKKAEINRLKEKIKHCKLAILRTEQFVLQHESDEVTDLLLEQLQARKESLKVNYQKVQDNFVDLSCLSGSGETDNNLEEIETIYLNTVSKINILIGKKQINNCVNSNSLNNVKLDTNVSMAKLKPIDIPVFDGKNLNDFKPFFDMFVAIIDKNSLSNVEKLFYLKNYLKGEALALINNLPLINDSYNEALSLLSNRYDNKSILINSHIFTILDLPAMQKGNTIAIREFVSKVRQQVGALRNLNLPVDSWDSILVCILSRKLDGSTNRAYQLDRDSTKLATLNEFLCFLENRATALESVLSDNKIFTILSTLILGALCLPYPPGIIIPDLDVSPPEEINSLSLSKFQSRSINVGAKENNFEDTIKEVESILKTNPALPRLTRGEILDLLDNITQTDLEKSRFINKTRDQKAIMVVMPFTPSNDNNMQDLYTKPPVTHIIGGEPFTKPANNKPNFKRKPTTSTSTSTTEKPRRYSTKKPFVPKNIEKKQRQKQDYTTTTTIRRRPEYTTTDITTIYRNPESTTQYSITYRSRSRGTPMRRRRPTSTKPTVKYSNHKYPEDQTSDETNKYVASSGISVVESPDLSQGSQPQTDLSIEEDTKKETVYLGESKLPHKFVTQAPLGTNLPQNQIVYGTTSKQVPIEILSIITSTQKPQKFDFTTASATIEDLNIPIHLNGVVKDMHLDAAMSGNIDLPTIKPMPDFKAHDDTDKIKAMLESLGIYTPTTTTKLPDVKNVADNLSPDMKELLMNFGLLPNPNEKPDVAVPDPNPEKAEITPDSFVGFKPLPDDSNSRSEMDELLASFGLGRKFRREKALSNNNNNIKETEINLEAVPEEYKGLLKELGLKQGRKIRTEPIEKNVGKEASVEKQHIFNPTDSQYATEEELHKLDKLIGMVKELEKLNRTITDEDLKNLDLETLKDLLGSLNQSSDLVPLNEKQPGPNPVDYDFGLTKNEVKRQENTTVSPSSTTTESTEIVTASGPVVEESRIKDLEDSFGGQTSTTTAPVVTSTTRRTGFYYLVDWNTFLEIDDQKGKRVNLRFQPTIGDPKRFYSVSVP